jgi:hypothetical protein
VSVAAPSPVRTRPAPPAPARPRRPRARPAAAPRRVTAGGLVWVLVLAALLGGIVALNVAALRTNIRVSGLSDRAAALQQANRTLSAQVATLTVPYRIDARAQQLGMVRPNPAARDYIPFKARRVDHRARAFVR